MEKQNNKLYQDQKASIASPASNTRQGNGTVSFADSTAGNNPAAVELPKGGGAIRSMGEKFSANPVTGTASFSIPLPISKARNKFQPELSLSYNSGGGNSPFGMGWDVGIASITRKTSKGLPKYIPEDVFILAGAEDLVPVLQENGEPYQREEPGAMVFRYRPRVEGLYNRIERWEDKNSGVSHWRVTDKENVTSIFGQTAQARVFDPNNRKNVFQWKIEKRFDALGNCIQFEYKRENQENINKQESWEGNRLAQGKSYNQLYVKRIFYGNSVMYPSASFETDNQWYFQLVFDYGEHLQENPTPVEENAWPVRKDPFSSYKAGFELRTYRMCYRALLFHQFSEENEGNPFLVKSLELEYDENPIASQLIQVFKRGWRDGTTETIPPLKFSYTQAELNPIVQELNPEITKNLPAGLGGEYRWADLYGEGISGILNQSGGAWFYQANEGDQNYYQPHPNDEEPTPVLDLAPVTKLKHHPIAGTPADLQDIDGDGKPEVVIRQQGLHGFYKWPFNAQQELEMDTGYFQPFHGAPNFTEENPNVRFIDLTGDGLADIMITEEDRILWMAYDEERPGYGKPHQIANALEEEIGPRLVFANREQNIFLADMAGDGLSDLVRIENGSVCYWPNKGYGRFGAKITMGGMQHFDRSDLFDANRIRLGDTDGSGTTDIIYLGSTQTRYFLNQSGNSFAAPISLELFPKVDNLEDVSLQDLFGNGTACLVWSSPEEKVKPFQIKYIDLMGQKPYLLEETDNGMGGIRKFSYAPSTKFYLRDRREGKPWVTRLPFPVQTLERVEVFEQITQRRFVTRYAYHHGYYDQKEREFRGFGMVEQWDSETYASFNLPALFQVGSNALEEHSHTPPIYTKTWFHNGYYAQSPTLIEAYQKEYWKEDPEAWQLPPVVFSSEQYQDWSPEEFQEAHRALKGSMLRQEVYGLDESTKENTPYQVTQNSFYTDCLQYQQQNRHAIFRVVEKETLAYNYEREVNDPRINHQLTLETDDYGQILQAAKIGYPRRGNDHEPEQMRSYISVNEASFINKEETLAFYRVGATESQSLWEFRAENTPAPVNDLPPWRPEILKNAIDTANIIPPQVNFSGSGDQKQIQSQAFATYYSQDLSNELPIGEIAAHGLPYQNYQLAYTEGLIDSIYNTGTIRIDLTTTPNPITESGYVQTSFGNAEQWWVPSARMLFNEQAFYLPVKQMDPFGGQTQLSYDSYQLLVVATEDSVGNTTTMVNDYYGLQPQQITDANGNRRAVVTDALNRVTALAVMGKAPNDPDYPDYEQGDSLAVPGTTFTYNLHAFQQSGEPASVTVVKRETHIHSPNANNETLTEVAYTDGLGKELQRRVQFGTEENGIMPVSVTGRQLKNNKDLVVVQFEPYLDSGLAYTENTAAEASKIRMYYDALNRLVRTDFEDGTFTKVAFNAWQQKEYDQNDTVIDSQWYIDRGSPDPSGSEPNNPEERAAWLSAKAYNTPRVLELDSLGRMFLRRNDNGIDGTPEYYDTRFELDIQGRRIKSTNPLAQDTIFKYSLLAPPSEEEKEQKEENELDQIIYTHSPDSGWRLQLKNVLDNLTYLWNERGNVFRYEFDILQRPLMEWMDEGSGEKLTTYKVYGDWMGVPNPREKNLKNKEIYNFDQSGALVNKKFDFKENLLQKNRQLALNYQDTIDWSFLIGEQTLAELKVAADNKLQTLEYSNLYEFDALNRLISKTQPDGSKYSYSFNKAALLEKIATQLQHENSFTDVVNNITYNARQQKTAIYYSNGSQTKNTYDQETFRIIRILTTRNTGQDIMQDLNYTFDAVGNITEQVDNAQQAQYFSNTIIDPTNKYRYDSLYRLVQATGREKGNLSAPNSSGYQPDWIPTNGKSSQSLATYCEQYSYDEVGNILELTHKDTCGGTENWKRSYVYNNNIINNYLLNAYTGSTPPSSPQFTYDAHGNMLQMPHLQAINWDFADQMKSSQKTGEKTYYVYSGGERVRKIVVDISGSTEKIKYERFYLGEYEVYHKYNTTGELETERVTHHCNDESLVMLLQEIMTVNDGNSVENPITISRYQYGDQLDSAKLELNQNAEVLSYEEYHPFGTTSFEMHTNDSEVSLKRYKYVHKERDNETGLYYYGARYYAAWLGRFTACDPKANKYLDWSSYNYTLDNPIRFTDPDGREPRTIADPPIWEEIARFKTTNTSAFKFSKEKGNFTIIPISKNNTLGERTIYSKKIDNYQGSLIQKLTGAPNLTYSVKSEKTTVQGTYYDNEGNIVYDINKATTYTVYNTKKTTIIDLGFGEIKNIAKIKIEVTETSFDLENGTLVNPVTNRTYQEEKVDIDELSDQLLINAANNESKKNFEEASKLVIDGLENAFKKMGEDEFERNQKL